MNKFAISAVCTFFAFGLFLGKISRVDDVFAKTAEKQEKQDNASTGTLVEITGQDMFTGIIDGDPNGSHEIVLLSSPSCEVCKRFHDDTYEHLVQFAKENGIKIRLEFYIDKKYVLEFVKIISAIPMNNKTKLALYKSLLKNQSKLLKKSKKKKLECAYKYATDLGINIVDIERLRQDEKLSKVVLEKSKIIDKSVKSDFIPAISVNGVELAGEQIHSIKEIKKFITRELHI